MKRYDAVIVGGGPIGSYTAKELALRGHTVALYEEHDKIGQPLKCAGLVTSRALEFLPSSKKEIIQNEIFGAQIHSPSGEEITIGGDKVHAYAINRVEFDKEMIYAAQESGAEIFLHSRVVKAKKDSKTMHVYLSDNRQSAETKTSLLIGADGPHSKIRESLFFPRPAELLKGFGAEVTNVQLDPKYVHIFVGTALAPGFFAWVIPLDERGTTARIGLCSIISYKESIKQCFSNLLKKHILKNCKIQKYLGGSIPLGPLKQTVQAHVMLVGDAAAQVKPTSGGGIYPGLLCARHCIQIANEALEKQRFSEQTLKKYHRLWSNDIGRELSRGMKFRQIFKNLSDQQMNTYLEKLNTKKTLDTINKYGDIDYPSKLTLPLLKSTPSLLKLLPSAFRTKKQ